MQLVSLVTFTATIFRKNFGNLLIGTDGSYMMEIVKQQHVWSAALPGLTSNFFQSLDNIWFPLSAWLVPEYALSLDSGSGLVDPVFCYVIVSVELFAAVYLLCCAIARDRVVAAMAAWALVLLTMPVIGLPAIYGIYALAPHLASEAAVVLLVLVLFSEIGRGSILRTLACGCLLLGTFLWLLLLAPMYFVVVAPTLGLVGLCFTITAGGKPERNAKWAMAAVLVGLFFATGIFQFLLGLYQNTAVYFFSSELMNTWPSLDGASIVFHRKTYGAAGPVLFWLALAGAVLAAIGAKEQVRVLAFGVLAFMGLLVGAGAILSVFDFWRGPLPVYFEFFLWPFYAMYAAIFVRFLFSVCMLAYRRWWVHSPAHEAGHQSALAQLAVGAALACAPWLIPAVTHAKPGIATRDLPYPQKATPIVEFLKAEVGLTPGATFRGRVATFTGLRINKPVSWLNMHGIDYEIARQFGNDHRMGLWFYDIPTLFEYNQFISPAFYRITRDILGRTGDQHMRTVVTLRRVEPRLLRLFGVRYVIADAPLDADVRLVMRLPKTGDPRLYLYEIDGANTGNFSPTKSRRYSAAREVMAALEGNDFDGAREVFAETALPEGLVAASSAKLVVEKEQLRISAHSDGHSVIVLPVEYSHCFDFQLAAPAAENPVLFRANLIQAGILFSGSLEATLSYFTGPFHNSGCRIEDVRDMERLNIRAASIGYLQVGNN